MSKATRPSILAVHPGALGDVVLLGHLLAALNGRVTLLAGGEKARLLAGLGVVDAALDFDSLPMHELFCDAPLDACRLPGLIGRHERLLSCFAEDDEPALARLAAACGAVEAACLPVRAAPTFEGHLVELWWSGLRRKWPHAAPRREPLLPTTWSVPQTWREQAAGGLAELGLPPGRRYVAIHPGAGAAAKCWPLERFLDVAAALRDDGLGAVFALGPVEMDRWRDGRVERITREFPALLAEPLAVLAGVLAGAAAYVGNDSGASHLAAAVGTPTVALFGPTDRRHFRPLGQRVETIAAAAMEAIQAARVLEAARVWL